MSRYWIWPITRDNFRILRASKFQFMDFKKSPRVLKTVSQGDRVGVYISKRYGGRMHIEAILEVQSDLYERPSHSPLVWQEETVSRRIQWPFRIDTSLIEETDVDLPSIFQSMESPSAKEKARGGAGLGLFLQGATLKEVKPNDWALIEGRSASSTTSPPAVADARPQIAEGSTPRTALPRHETPLSQIEDRGSAPQPSAPEKGTKRPKRRMFGAPLNFRELRHVPINEQGVVYLFGMVARELGFLVEGVATEFPDCDAKRITKSGLYETVKIEFEYKAGNFRLHGHDPARCDLVVCWENDWPTCPVEVLELRSEIQKLGS